MTPSSSQLALYGGPAVIRAGPPDWPLSDPDVWAALQEVYASGDWGRYHGTHCRRLAEALAAMHTGASVTLCCSGTIAVELALRGLGVGPGDEVVLAGYDFPGNFRAIEAAGAMPVLVDIDPDTWSLDAEGLPEALGEKTKAIVASHLHGGLAPMRRMTELAAARGIGVVEDACQAPGAIVDDRVAGTWGDVGVLSFGGSKLLSAGRGGAVLVRDPAVQQRIKVFTERGNDAFALSELQAAVLLPQLEKLAERNATRAKRVERLLTSLQSGLAADVLRPVKVGPSDRASFYKLAFDYEPRGTEQAERETLIAAAQAEGVALDAGFRGFVRRSPRRCRKTGPLEHSTQAAAATLLLHHPVLLGEPKDIDLVADALNKVVSALCLR